MAFDIVVFDDDFRFQRELHLDESVHGLLFRKLVTPGDYPSLGRAADTKEDISFDAKELPALLADVTRLESHLASDKLMSPEIKKKCVGFVSKLREMCELALSEGRSVDFVAGDEA
ncbi:MAG TPA: hypothetical protein VJM83_00225 [Nitrospirota bacterium]|nr:hypothetical protein [Nitrospirota bacterium]